MGPLSSPTQPELTLFLFDHFEPGIMSYNMVHKRMPQLHWSFRFSVHFLYSVCQMDLQRKERYFFSNVIKMRLVFVHILQSIFNIYDWFHKILQEPFHQFYTMSQVDTSSGAGLGSDSFDGDHVIARWFSSRTFQSRFTMLDAVNGFEPENAFENSASISLVDCPTQLYLDFHLLFHDKAKRTQQGNLLPSHQQDLFM